LEPRTAAWFRVSDEDVVVDVGAHIGRYALVAARKASLVVAVEPNPSNFSILQENVALNGFDNVISLPFAVSDKKGRSGLFVSLDGDTAISSLEPKWSERLNRTSGGKPLDVQCETLDRIVSDLNLTVIDWLKIDVEGHEVLVLKGAESALQITRNLILEVTAGNEELCRNETKRAGLELIATETQRDSVVSNWLLKRTS
jgi:FkbM family methyltransferase